MILGAVGEEVNITKSESHGKTWEIHGLGYFIELDDGKIYRKALYLMVKTKNHGFL